MLFASIVYNKTLGSLKLDDESLVWTPNTGTPLEIKCSQISRLLVSKSGRHAVKLVMRDTSSYSFTFESADSLLKFNEKLGRILTTCGLQLGLSPEIEMQLRAELLKTNRALLKLHQELVGGGLLSETDFWASRKNLLLAMADEHMQRRGLRPSGEFKPIIDDGTSPKYTLTPQMISGIFAHNPAVLNLYNENVPDKMSEREFWSQYLSAKCAKNTKTVFSDTVCHFREKICFIPNVYNVEMTESDQISDAGMIPDVTMKIKKSSLIRTINMHSDSVLKSTEFKRKYTDSEAFKIEGLSWRPKNVDEIIKPAIIHTEKVYLDPKTIEYKKDALNKLANYAVASNGAVVASEDSWRAHLRLTSFIQTQKNASCEQRKCAAQFLMDKATILEKLRHYYGAKTSGDVKKEKRIKESLEREQSRISANQSNLYNQLRADGKSLLAETVAGVSFSSQRLVWIPDKEEGYVQATIVADSPDTLTVAVNGIETKVSKNDTQKVNPPNYERCPNMAEMAFLNEASVIQNIKLRYFSNLIYTYSGLFLVAVNPFKNLNIYSDVIVSTYKNKRRNENPPHIFAVADSAYRAMILNNENQSLLITGESGAGKTVSTKKVIQYISCIAGESKVDLKSASLDDKIIQSNPIMESFGNAQTIRNNNSSRFGKFIRIEFNNKGEISGANIQKYLLEKSRVTHQTSKERNYHVFYQLLNSNDPQLLKSLLLSSTNPDAYRYLRNSNKLIANVDDSADYKDLVKAMDIVGFGDEKTDFFKAIALVLLFGNIECDSDSSNQANISDASVTQKICHILNISEAEFVKCLCRPQIKAGRDWVTQCRTVEQVISSVDALARAIYERMFDALIARINKALDISTNRSTFIGVLDIAGFEIFQKNSFEQLCINFTNECLQQFFNTHMFLSEQEEYKRENIEWRMIDFGLDLQPCIDLIEKGNPIGIFACLDEECILPKATDKTFTDKIASIAKNNPKFSLQRFFDGFVVHHYAGSVPYNTDGWIEKNKDPLNTNVCRLIASSPNAFFAKLFSEFNKTEPNYSQICKNGAFRTVAQKHKEQLHILMDLLRSTQPHFVRCIIPNNLKKPDKIDNLLVLDQLRCNGVIEGIRICRAGYPNRIPFSIFRQKFEIMCPNAIPKGFMDGREASLILLESMGLDKKQYSIGTSKVFFRAGVLQEMEANRDKRLSQVIISFQAMCRGFLARIRHKKLHGQLNACRVLQRNIRIYNELVNWPWFQLYVQIRPLLEVGRTEDEMRKKDEKITDLENSILSERAEKDKIEALKSQLELERKAIETALFEEKHACIERDNQLAETRSRIATLQEEYDDICKENTELCKANEEISLSKQKLEIELKQSIDDAEKQQAALEAVQSECLNKKEQIKRLESNIYSIESLKTSLEGELYAKKQECSDLKQRLDDALSNEANTLKKKRALENTVGDLQEHINKQVQDISTLNKRKGALEAEITRLKSELVECDRQKQDLEILLKRKEAELDLATQNLVKEIADKDTAEKLCRELATKCLALEADLESQDHEKTRAIKKYDCLKTEYDELKQSIDEMTSAEFKNTESRRITELEIANLKSQIAGLQQECDELKRKCASGAQVLWQEKENAASAADAAEKTRKKLESKIQEILSELEETVESRNKLEKQRKDIQSENNKLNALRADLEDKLSQCRSEIDMLERQNKAHVQKSEEDSVKIENLVREASAFLRETSSLSDQLYEIRSARENVEKMRKTLISKLGDSQVKIETLEAELQTTSGHLASKTAECAELQRKYNEDAVVRYAAQVEVSRKLEREVDELKTRLSETEERETLLQRAKAWITAESEDLKADLERKEAMLRNSEKQTKILDSEKRLLVSSLEAEQKTVFSLESRVASAQTQLDSLKTQLEEKDSTIETLRQAKNDADQELRQLIDQVGDGTRNLHELEKSKRKLEHQVLELQQSLDICEENLLRSEDLRRKADDMLCDIRQKKDQEIFAKDKQIEETKKAYMREINTLGATVEAQNAQAKEWAKTRAKLELEIEELSTQHDSSARSKGDLEKIKKKLDMQVRELQTQLEESERTARNYMELAENREKRANELLANVEELEQTVETLEREKKRAERTVTELSAELEESEGKNQLIETKKRLEKELAAMAESLEMQVELRLEAEKKATRDVDIDSRLCLELRTKIESLEENRRAMNASIRQLQTANDGKTREVEMLEKQKKAFIAEIDNLKVQIEAEAASKQDEALTRRRMAAELKEMQFKLESQQQALQELESMHEMLKFRAESAKADLEEAELARIRVEKSEAHLRSVQTELEDKNTQMVKERASLQERLRAAESANRDLTIRLEDLSIEINDLEQAKRKAVMDLERERESLRNQLLERDDIFEQTKRRSSKQITELTRELESERSSCARLKADISKYEKELVQQQGELDEYERQRTALLKEKERLELRVMELQSLQTELNDLELQLNVDTAQYMCKIKGLRAELEEQEQKTLTAEKARNILQQALEQSTEDLNKSIAARDAAQRGLSVLERDLEQLRIDAEEHDDRNTMLSERLVRTEQQLQQSASDLQMHKERLADAERAKIIQDRTIKELSTRVEELIESRDTAATRALMAKIEDQNGHIDRLLREREDMNRETRRSNRSVKELQQKLDEALEQRQQAETEARAMEAKFRKIKKDLEDLETREMELQISKRRVDREYKEAQERINRLESEVKRVSTRSRSASIVSLNL